MPDAVRLHSQQELVQDVLGWASVTQQRRRLALHLSYT